MIPKNSSGGQSVQIDTRLARVYRMKKGVMTTARLVNDRLKNEPIRWVPVMVTLTYAKPDDWQPNQITQFVNRVQMYAKRRGYTFPNVWVMELTKAGVPHYHCLFWIPARLRLPHSDRQGWWSHGSTNLIRVKNAVGYVAKYASKFESKDATFPHGCRIHGIGGITKLEKRVVAWWKLPKDLRTGDEGSVSWSRRVGGGWVCRETGELKDSLWGLSAVGDGVVRLARKSAGSSVAERVALASERNEEGTFRGFCSNLALLSRLSHLRETDHYALVSFFEEVAQQGHDDEASQCKSIPLVRPMTDQPERLRLSVLHAAPALIS